MFCDEMILEKYQSELLNYLFNAKKDCITMIWNEENDIILVTKTFENYFAASIDTVINRPWQLIFPDHIVQRINAHFDQSSETLHIPWLIITCKHNVPTYFTITIELMDVGSERFYICTMTDHTKKHQLEMTLCRVEKLLLSAQLSANIVHEIKNPLTSIKGFLQLIQAGVEHREEYFQVLINEIDKIESLTYELLQMANPNKDKKQSISVEKLLNDVIFLMKTQATMKMMTFDIVGDLDVSIYCNPNEMKQVLINLILNGADAMDRKGTITIKVENEGDSVKIEVIDKGHGMSEETMSRIFDAFYTTKENGTGLGLVVTNHIIEKHHGKLSIRSVENEGSTFEIQLPIILTN